jgi:alkyl sulfatase BDS1-like metallo-beta-lactamase superfamily hydrolase
MGADSLVLALRASFNGAAAAGLGGRYELIVDELPFRIELSSGSFAARRGEADRPDARIRSDVDTLTGVVFRGRSLADALRAGTIEITGEERAATRLLRLLAAR